MTIHRAGAHPAAAGARPVSRVQQRTASPRRTAPAPQIASWPRQRRLSRAAAAATPHPSIPSKIERDEAGFAQEVAQLNAQNDILTRFQRSIPARGSRRARVTRFDVPSSLRGDEHGNGIITPTRSWRDNGHDCYYGRYEYTYPDGAKENGDIVWPFCFDPGSDPFKEPPHPIPFPLPLLGFKLPPDTQLPPIEKPVYDQWAAERRRTSAP